MKRKWKLRIALTVGLLVGLVLMLGGGAWYLVRGKPSWYTQSTLSPSERADAARQLENKLIETRNWASASQAAERASDRQARQAASTRPIGSVVTPAPVVTEPITVTFTQEELNAFFQKWSVTNGWKSNLDRFVTDPLISLQKNRVIFAGLVTSNSVNSVLSVHFSPRITPEGKLDVNMDRILAGRLPMPEAVLSDYRNKVIEALHQKLPVWQTDAKLDASGTTNQSFVHAAMGKLMLATLTHTPAEPVIFLPIDQRGIAAKLTGMSVDDGSITFTVERITPEDRADLLERLREPVGTARVQEHTPIIPVSR